MQGLLPIVRVFQIAVFNYRPEREISMIVQTTPSPRSSHLYRLLRELLHSNQSHEKLNYAELMCVVKSLYPEISK